jgi:DNA-binding CsgD family transcriptional regulator
MLLGRSRECEALDGLLNAVRAGHSRSLVVRGDAGIGKTALLDFAVNTASGFRVVRTGGVESEMVLPFATLNQVCGRMVERIDRLPEPQADAVAVAFGLRAGPAPERYLVGLGALALLRDQAQEQPVLCVVDDAQWVDLTSVQALAFVARRLEAAPVGLVFGVRGRAAATELAGLPELHVGGLSDADARDLLASVIPGRLDEQVRDRIVAEARGNPQALIELPHGLAVGALAGGFGLPSAGQATGRLDEHVARRVAALPAATRRVLLLAAAEPVGDPALFWRAGARLGIGVDDAAMAEAEGLVEFGTQVRFPHPLVRSAVYAAAPVGDRQRVHRALAAAIDPQANPDRRAWHRAHAARLPDEEVADELVRLAGRARVHGGVAAAAAFVERAAALTPDPVRRASRALAAAQAKHEAGAHDAAFELLAVAGSAPLDELPSARLDLLRAQITFTLRRGGDAPRLLLESARRLETLDAGLARETYVDAFVAAAYAGRLASDGQEAVAEAARLAPPAPQPPRAVDLLLDGLVIRFTEGYPASVPLLRAALDAFRAAPDARWLWFAATMAVDLWDDDTWHALAARQVRFARDGGALEVLPLALDSLAAARLHAGDLAAAAALIDEATAIANATGTAPAGHAALVLAAWRGDDNRTSMLAENSMRDATARGEGTAITMAEYATAVLHNGLSRYEAALGPAQRACDQDEAGFASWAAPELVEAASRTGHPRLAGASFERLTERASAAGTDWALGVSARSHALLSRGPAAEELYRQAIERSARCRITLDFARAHLVYGEWLRRERRRADARGHLRTAYEILSSAGATAFAERAARELVATGERLRRRVTGPRQLTSQETEIAQLASEGRSNPEIAATLFISPRTVEYHLHKVFTKLGISSRHQLGRASDPGDQGAPQGSRRRDW